MLMIFVKLFVVPVATVVALPVVLVAAGIENVRDRLQARSKKKKKKP